MGDFERLYQNYRGRKVQFLQVYIRGEQTAFDFPMAQRIQKARQLLAEHHLTIPTVVDTVDDRAALAYNAFPERVILLDLQGRVVGKSRFGPGSLSPGQVARWLKQTVK